MTVIEVSASKKYNILIGEGLLQNSGELIKNELSATRAAIVTDDTVDGLYSEAVIGSLNKAGISTVKHVVPHGENSKSAECYIKLLNRLAEERFTRSDILVALGGGVVGDLCGFTAASYLRGIRFVQIPTTLLAMVDSSVGGKTAINLDAGKNLAGAFYQPSLVICDTDALSTLPDDIFRAGTAEVVKYACLGNAELYEHLDKYGQDFDRSFVIKECVAQKRDIVNADEFDTGVRQMLNFGHTVGHAVEKLSGYEISHGFAVAAGMGIISECCMKAGLCSEDAYKRIISLIKRFDLPCSADFGTQDILRIIESDKKIKGGSITAVVPDDDCKCVLRSMSLDEFKNLIERGM